MRNFNCLLSRRDGYWIVRSSQTMTVENLGPPDLVALFLGGAGAGLAARRVGVALTDNAWAGDIRWDRQRSS